MSVTVERGGRVLRNTLWLSAAPIFLNVLSIFALGTIARTLGGADFGRFNVAFALAGLCQAFSGLGLSTATIRTLSAQGAGGGVDPARYAGSMIVLRLLLALGAHVVLGVLTVVLGHDAPTRFAALLAGGSLYFMAISQACQDVFAAYEDMGPPARANLVGGVLLTVGSVVVLLVGGRLDALVLVYVAGSALTTILSLRVLHRRHFVPVLGLSLGFARTAAREGFVFFAGGVLMAVMLRADVLLLSALRGQTEAGIYAAASNIFQKLYVVPVSMAAAALPALSTLAASQPRAARDLLERCLLFGLIITVPLAVGGAIVATPLVHLVFGAAFEAAAPSLAFGLVTIPLLLIGQVLARALAAVHEERKGLIAQGVGMALMMGLEVVLAPRQGAWGTALAACVGHVATCGLCFIWVRPHLHVRPGWAAAARMALALVLMAAALTLLAGRVHVLLQVAAGGLLYGLAVVGLGAMPLAEVRRMLGLRPVSRPALQTGGTPTGRSAADRSVRETRPSA